MPQCLVKQTQQLTPRERIDQLPRRRIYFIFIIVSLFSFTQCPSFFNLRMAWLLYRQKGTNSGYGASQPRFHMLRLVLPVSKLFYRCNCLCAHVLVDCLHTNTHHLVGWLFAVYALMCLLVAACHCESYPFLYSEHIAVSRIACTITIKIQFLAPPSH